MQTFFLLAGFTLNMHCIFVSFFGKCQRDGYTLSYFFHYRNALSMMIFMYIGYLLKDLSIKDRTLLKAGILYVAAYCVSFVLLFFDVSIPYFTPQVILTI